MVKCGMYTDGKTVVTVVNVCNGEISYVQGYSSAKANDDDADTLMPEREFTCQYPYPITGVVVQHGKESKEEPIEEMQYYTDGEVIVFVIEAAPRYVYFYQDHPFVKGEQQLLKKVFRHRFPYTTVGVTLE